MFYQGIAGFEISVKELLNEWEGKTLKGFSWNFEKLKQHIESQANARVLAMVEEKTLRNLIVFRCLGEEAEIDLVVKKPNSTHMELVIAFEELFNAYGQVKSWWLEVHCQNKAAQALYEQVGFLRGGVRKNYYPDKEDALIYNCKR